MLNERIQTHEDFKNEKEKLKGFKYKTEKDYKQEFQFLSEVDSAALQQSRRNLEQAYKNFYSSIKGIRKGEKVGFPKFKSKHNHNDSYRTVQGIHCDFGNKSVRVPIVG